MSKHIVLAEDEAHIARLVSFKLEREGYTVTWVENGGEALEKVRETKPDLLVLDIMMPVMTGYEVLKHVREDEELRSIPVVMLTARGQEQDVVRGFDLGADDYIAKPFRPAELVVRIERLLKK